MKYDYLMDELSVLENKIFDAIRFEIIRCGVDSKFTNDLVLKVNIYKYVELGIINNKFTFMDGNGYQYEIWAEATVEDLVNILNEL